MVECTGRCEFRLPPVRSGVLRGHSRSPRAGRGEVRRAWVSAGLVCVCVWCAVAAAARRARPPFTASSSRAPTMTLIMSSNSFWASGLLIWALLSALAFCLSTARSEPHTPAKLLASSLRLIHFWEEHTRFKQHRTVKNTTHRSPE